MPKRGLPEVSGHHVEKKRFKRKKDHSIRDGDGMEHDDASTKKKGCMVSINETHSNADSTGESSAASLSQVDQVYISSESEFAHAATANKFIPRGLLPVENADLSESIYSECEESSSSEDFESHNDLNSTLLQQRNAYLKRRKVNLHVLAEYGSGGNVCVEPSLAACHPDNNENSAVKDITGDGSSVKNSINGEKLSQPYLTEELSDQANAPEKDVIGMTTKNISCSAEVFKQHLTDSIPLLTECGNDNNSETKSQTTATDKVNPGKFKEDISTCTFPSTFSLQINQKVLSGNFKGDVSLPPSPITGVIDSFVDKPNRKNNHLNSLNVEETAFSFQLPNKKFCKEIPNTETAFEMQDRLGRAAESHDCSQNLREHSLNVVSLGIYGDKVTQEKESIASISCSSTSEDDSISKLSKREVQEVFSLLPERSLTRNNRKKLLVLDLNGLLCDIVNDYTLNRAEKKIGGKPIFKRPYCDDFLKFCFDKFDIGIWSSRRKYNIDSALDYLMGEFKHKLLFCWDQSKCTFTGFKTLENHYKPLVLKELKKIWDKEESDFPWEKREFSPSNTLLLDDSPYKALFNPPHTAIFPYPYHYTDEGDKSLGPGGDIRVYLENLFIANDVQHYVEAHPFGQPPITAEDQHWNFYCSIIKGRATSSL